MGLAFDGTFEGFRRVARVALARGIAPDAVHFSDARAPQRSLFGETAASALPAAPPISISRAWLRDAELAALHRDEGRWQLLYRLLFRGTREPALLGRATDPDVRALALLVAAVRRDIHKMHAFVRFRRVHGADGHGWMGAFYEPDHRVARRAMPHFVDRFRSDRLVVATPEVTLRWDGEALRESSGIASMAAFRAAWPDCDGEEDVSSLFGTYYASVFNPARLNERAMQAEMPVRFWKHMPEAKLIPGLVADARARTRGMIDTGVAASVPAQASLPVIADVASACGVCPHAAHASRAVPGDGPSDARIVFIGEQPGDEEDRRGLPFVGPAGRVLRTLLDEARIDASTVYLTNAVKHFTFEPRGKARLHKKPAYGAVRACRPLLLAELAAVRPRVIVCLGATAGQSLLGAGFRLAQARGKLVPQPWAPALVATYHPSAILRASSPDEAAQIRAQLAADLARARALAELAP